MTLVVTKAGSSGSSTPARPQAPPPPPPPPAAAAEPAPEPDEKMDVTETKEELPPPQQPPPAAAAPVKRSGETLSTVELQILSELDSTHFGFIKLNDEAHAGKKSLVVRAVRYLEKFIVQCRERRKAAELNNNNGKIAPGRHEVDPKLYCKIGHLHLLLDDFSKALSAYQKFYGLSREGFWRDAAFLYGLGLVYFHFNSYTWAKKAFQLVLYADSGFPRANEVHIRLGLIAKVEREFATSLRHFKIAEEDSSPCSFTRSELQFHMAHLHEVRGDSAQAKTLYEKLLEVNQPDQSKKKKEKKEVKEEKSEKPEATEAATEAATEEATDGGGSSSSSSDEEDEDEEEEAKASSQLPQNLKADIHRQLGWMFHSVESLGEKAPRMQSAIQHLQKSLECDPKSVQSLYLLGRCYASVGQVHDAFISYRSSVDRSEGNADTWCSIGVLYQQQNQPMDALQAYICAVQLDKDHTSAWTNLGVLYESFNQPQDSLASYEHAVRKRLPPASADPKLRENLPQRIKYLKAQLANMPPQPPQTPATPAPGGKKPLPSLEEAWNMPISSDMPNKQQANGGRPKDPKVGAPGPHPHPQQQAQVPKPSFYLNSQQLQTLQYLQQQPNLLPQQQQLLHQLQSQLRLMQQHQQQQRAQQQQAAMQAQQQQLQQQQQQQRQQQQENDLLSELQDKDLSSVSDKDLAALISTKDFGLLAESLLKEMQASDVDQGAAATEEQDTKEGLVKVEPGTETPERASNLDIPTEVKTVKYCKQKSLRVNVDMRAREVVTCCESVIQSNAKFAMSTSLLPDATPPPAGPQRPAVKPDKEQLLPPTTSILLENKKDVFSQNLQDCCQQNPITIVRGIAAALKLDLGLFSTKLLQEEFPGHQVEVLTQQKQNPDENVDKSGKPVWTCAATKCTSSLTKIATYQIGTFQENLKDETEKPGSSPAEKEAAKARKLRLQAMRAGMIKFASVVELADARKFRNQHTELTKLPVWLRCVSASNMLSHIGSQVHGLNTVRLSMKVPGARVAAFQEVSGFCTVNINIGPGDCEWFGVADEYAETLKKLCDKHGVDFRNGSWWPLVKDLHDEDIPVYRFLQKPGDLVWVNSGCVHWAQADGWCNNISWNVGPLTLTQYKHSLERFEWNKMQYVCPSVPMTSLTWNIARNIRLQDVKLFDMMKFALLQSLKQAALTLELVKAKGIEVQKGSSTRGRASFEASKFCDLCVREVFAVLFVRGEELASGSKSTVHCINCALRKKPDLKGFICLEEIRLRELCDVYDNFKPHSVSTPQLPGPSPSTAVSMPPSSTTMTPPSAAPAAKQAKSSPGSSQSAAAAAAAAAQAKAAQAALSAYAARADKMTTAASMQSMQAAMAAAMQGASMTPAEQAALAAAMFSQYGASGLG